MKQICKLIGLLSLLVIVMLPLAFLLEMVSLDAMKQGLFIATLAWFGTAFFWIGTSPSGGSTDF